MAASGSSCCPETEGTIYVDPCTCPLRDVTYIVNRIAGARVYVSQLCTDDGRTAKLRNVRRQHAALRVHRNADDPTAAEAKQSKRFQHGGVHLIANNNLDRRCSKQAITLHIPPDIPK